MLFDYNAMNNNSVFTNAETSQNKDVVLSAKDSLYIGQMVAHGKKIGLVTQIDSCLFYIYIKGPLALCRQFHLLW